MVFTIILNKPEQNPRLKINQGSSFTPTPPAGRVLQPTTAADQRLDGRNSRLRDLIRPETEPAH
jgi:hypothetical protein